MLTDTERAAALKIILLTSDPEEYAAVDDRLCAKYPAIETEDLASLWQEAGERYNQSIDETAEQ